METWIQVTALGCLLLLVGPSVAEEIDCEADVAKYMAAMPYPDEVGQGGPPDEVGQGGPAGLRELVELAKGYFDSPVDMFYVKGRLEEFQASLRALEKKDRRRMTKSCFEALDYVGNYEPHEQCYGSLDPKNREQIEHLFKREPKVEHALQAMGACAALSG